MPSGFTAPTPFGAPSSIVLKRPASKAASSRMRAFIRVERSEPVVIPVRNSDQQARGLNSLALQTIAVEIGFAEHGGPNLDPRRTRLRLRSRGRRAILAAINLDDV